MNKDLRLLESIKKSLREKNINQIMALFDAGANAGIYSINHEVAVHIREEYRVNYQDKNFFEYEDMLENIHNSFSPKDLMSMSFMMRTLVMSSYMSDILEAASFPKINKFLEQTNELN